jgi:hypothetical protein
MHALVRLSLYLPMGFLNLEGAGTGSGSPMDDPSLFNFKSLLYLTDRSEGCLIQIIEKHGSPHFPSQPPHIPDAHGAHDLEQRRPQED